MKILVADDHALFRAGLRVVVEQLEAQMVEAHDWQSALAAVAAQPDIALALVDRSMPGRESFAGDGVDGRAERIHHRGVDRRDADHGRDADRDAHDGDAAAQR